MNFFRGISDTVDKFSDKKMIYFQFQVISIIKSIYQREHNRYIPTPRNQWDSGYQSGTASANSQLSMYGYSTELLDQALGIIVRNMILDICSSGLESIPNRPDSQVSVYSENAGMLVDNGTERKGDFADDAQVFMVGGLIYNYKQAVSYTFASSATKGPELAKQIKEVVSSLQEAGLIVVASVCDQGTNNRQALKLLVNETRGLLVCLRKGEEPKICNDN